VKTELLRYLPTFRLVAEELSFSAAARRLGVTPAAVSKSMRTLEAGLGVRLFHRSTHALTMTDEGAQLHRSTGPLLDALDESLARATNLPQTPRGLLRIAAPYGVGKHRLVPLVGEFRRRHPEVELDLRFEDTVVDLVKEGIDISISSRIDPNPSLVARKLYDTHAITVASPRFVETHGKPRRPRDVERFPCIRYRLPGSGRLYPWRFTDPKTRQTITVDPPATITASSLEIVAELAADGQGIALVGRTSQAPYLESGALVHVLQRYAHATAPMMLYYPSRHDLPARTRAFIDFAIEQLADS
jgi:DNA-binding transcriptional LysR family regulator